jgi:polyhydroxyalkanoate synthesis regulator phasin
MKDKNLIELTKKESGKNKKYEVAFFYFVPIDLIKNGIKSDIFTLTLNWLLKNSLITNEELNNLVDKNNFEKFEFIYKTILPLLREHSEKIKSAAPDDLFNLINDFYKELGFNVTATNEEKEYKKIKTKISTVDEKIFQQSKRYRDEIFDTLKQIFKDSNYPITSNTALFWSVVLLSNLFRKYPDILEKKETNLSLEERFKIIEDKINKLQKELQKIKKPAPFHNQNITKDYEQELISLRHSISDLRERIDTIEKELQSKITDLKIEFEFFKENILKVLNFLSE